MTPKYDTVYAELYGRLDNGTYRLGMRLPTEQQLAIEFGVNRLTLRRAITLLVEAGYLDRRLRTGIRVISTPKSGNHAGSLKLVYRIFAQEGPSVSTSLAKKLAQRFMELHPAMQVEVSPLKLSGSLMAPNVPEILGAPHPTILRCAYVADYAKRGALVALDEFDDLLDISPSLDGRGVYRTRDEAGRWRVHALPVQAGAWMMMANRTLVNQLGLSIPDGPMTWEEFTGLCVQITERGRSDEIRAIELEILQAGQSITRFLPFFYSASGGRMLIESNPGRVNFDVSGNAAALAFLVRLCQLGTCHLASTCHPNATTLSFLGRRAAFRLSVLSQSVEDARRRLPGDEIIALPHPLENTKSRPYTVLRGDFVGLLRNTIRERQEKQAAWSFVKFLLSAESQETAYREAGHQPVRLSMRHVVTADPLINQFFDYGMNYGLPTFDMPKNGDMHDIIRRAMVRAIRGECSPEQALVDGQEQLQLCIDQTDSRVSPRSLDPAMSL